MAEKRVQRRKPSFRAKHKKHSPGFLSAVSLVAVLAGVVVLVIVFGIVRHPAADAGLETGARQLEYEVVNSYPHDPTAFLQGLLWSEGCFYESAGLYGQSTLRRVEFPSGKILKSMSLPPELFGERPALIDNRLLQLTWKSKRGEEFCLRVCEPAARMC